MTSPMTDLSPAARAVADAFEKAWRLSPDTDPYECCVSPVAAALRAAADQVVPEEQKSDFVPGAPRAYEIQRCVIRHQLLAIAAELEGAGAA